MPTLRPAANHEGAAILTGREKMLRYALAMLGVLMATGLTRAEEPAADETPAIMVSLRFCEGDPKGKPEAIKVLSEPRIVTLSGRTAEVLVGGQKDFEGHAVKHGVHCEITPKLLEDETVLLQVRYECTALVGGEREDSVTAQGTCIRSSLVARPGEKVRVGGMGRDGHQGWLEISVDVIPPGDVLAMPTHEVREQRVVVDRPRHIWPTLKGRYKAGGRDMISGPFGHANP